MENNAARVHTISLKISNKRSTWQGKDKTSHDIWPFHYFADILNQTLLYNGIDFRNPDIKAKIFLFSFSDIPFTGYQVELKKLKLDFGGCIYKVNNSDSTNIYGKGWLPEAVSTYFKNKFPEKLYFNLEITNKGIIN